MALGELVLVAVVLLVTEAGGNIVSTDNFTLTILHVNDFHARFEETNVYSGRCTAKDKEKNRCYGGFARLKTAVTEEIASSPNVVYLSGGDYFQGTIWHTVFKWKALAHFLNLVPNHAMSFGNHEFDDGIDGDDGLVNFLKAITFPVLAANLDDEQEPSMQGLHRKSVVLEREGRKIGVVGYLSTETTMISNSRYLKITDEVTAVREEARRLKREENVDIIIALGHAGYSKDKDIAGKVEEVDVVVGGHSNTFLYNGDNPSTEVSVDQYPTVVKQSSGKQVPVVQAYAFGKYLGKLVLTFNAEGEVTAWDGNPIILNNNIKQDEAVLRELETWKSKLDAHIQDNIGRTFVFLEGNRLACRDRECNLGNLMTDAIVHVNAKYPDDLKWAHTSLAILNGGGIRASIDERSSNGSITMEDLLTVAPFQNTIDIVELKGKHVKEVFEHSIYKYDKERIDLSGSFLQVSGFAVVYDINLPAGSRVVRIQARCQECRVPEMRDLEEDKVYMIAMPSFVAMGGDGYTVIKDNKINHHLTGLLDTDAYMEYIQLITPIHQGTEKRILFIDTNRLCSGGDATHALASNIYTTVSSNVSTSHRGSVSESTKKDEDEDEGDGGDNGVTSLSRLSSSTMMVLVVLWWGWLW